MRDLDRGALAHVAEFFKAMGEPTRLHLLNVLREGEVTVKQLAERVDSTHANVSKHLSVLAKAGFVDRQMHGTSAYYRIVDFGIYELCDLVCGQIARRLSAQHDVQSMFHEATKNADVVTLIKRKNPQHS